MHPSQLLPLSQITKLNKPSLELIANQVATQLCFTADDLIGRKRTTDVVNARIVFVQVAIIYRYSATNIGKYLDGRDHSTILHALALFADFYTCNDAAIISNIAQVQLVFPNVIIKPYRDNEYQN